MTVRRIQFAREGFTLVELLMVVMIIGLLASIVIPVFNEQRSKAKDAVAQVALRTALTAARSWYSTQEIYAGFNSARPTFPEESTLSLSDYYDTDKRYTAANSTSDPNNILSYAGSPNGGMIILCNKARSGNSFCIVDVRDPYVAAWPTLDTPGTYFGKSPADPRTAWRYARDYKPPRW
jgi:prepilin-type N-terminal cleavage/methylation domain-containing protein